METKTLNEVISNYLNENNISQAQFGDMVGVTGRAIRWYITGVRVPTGTVLANICKITNTDIRTVKM